MKCDRCNREASSHRMSYFNTEIICHPCEVEEMDHPLYVWAKQVEHDYVVKEEYNFPGVFAGKTWDLIKEITAIPTSV
ncbi:hypothetical protein [Paenibacillus abyssi]|uniref:Uncharacterized protein n=1 Tax=Paenibacillus abyssi TaxID=1340531 RepID=A0A917LFJ3_9BACL|nr:hypothetical protein [Paenibacillus abyssi]GGG18352.1 hypothetical protein GCM10010916_38980 [Paenibacillus abyssi]